VYHKATKKAARPNKRAIEPIIIIIIIIIILIIIIIVVGIAAAYGLDDRGVGV
jgi:flagellar basal body-associated protein FliL